jgi:hypothetical protein
MKWGRMEEALKKAMANTSCRASDDDVRAVTDVSHKKLPKNTNISCATSGVFEIMTAEY